MYSKIPVNILFCEGAMNLGTATLPRTCHHKHFGIEQIAMENLPRDKLTRTLRSTSLHVLPAIHPLRRPSLWATFVGSFFPTGPRRRVFSVPVSVLHCPHIRGMTHPFVFPRGRMASVSISVLRCPHAGTCPACLDIAHAQEAHPARSLFPVGPHWIVSLCQSCYSGLLDMLRWILMAPRWGEGQAGMVTAVW